MIFRSLKSSVFVTFCVDQNNGQIISEVVLVWRGSFRLTIANLKKISLPKLNSQLIIPLNVNLFLLSGMLRSCVLPLCLVLNYRRTVSLGSLRLLKGFLPPNQNRDDTDLFRFVLLPLHLMLNYQSTFIFDNFWVFWYFGIVVFPLKINRQQCVDKKGQWGTNDFHLANERKTLDLY